MGGLALNNIVVLNADAVVLLYGLPLAAILGSVLLIERGRRTLRTSRSARLVSNILDAAGSAVGRLVQLGRPPPAAPGRARGAP
jgi:hypothetical protein